MKTINKILQYIGKTRSTDSLIHNIACHLNEHKLANISYLINGLHTYPISRHAKTIELETIKTIVHGN